MHRKNEAATVTLFKLCFLSYKWKKGNINVKV